MKSLLVLLIFASVLVVGCAGSSPLAPTAASPSSAISPSSVGGNGATKLSAGEALPPPAPEVDGISCPSDAPAFKAESTPGRVIKLEWQKMPKADYIRIYVWVERFGHWEIVEGSPKVVGEHGQWYDSFKVPYDGIYLVKLATVTCGEQRNLSDGIVVTFGEYVPLPTPIPDPPTPPSDDSNDSDNPPPPPCVTNCVPPPPPPACVTNCVPPPPPPACMTNCVPPPSPPSNCDVRYQGNGTVTGNSNGTVKLDSQLRNGTFALSIEYFKNGSWHGLNSDTFTVGCAQNTFPKSISGSKVSGATGYRFTIDPLDDGTLPTISGTQFGNGSANLD
jgi:hypothetical protein